MAALESKLETYEKEIKQLQKALENSDKLIAELELRSSSNNQNNDAPASSNSSSFTSSSFNDFSRFQNLNKNLLTNNHINNNASIKTESKNVKFSEKLDTVHHLTSPPGKSHSSENLRHLSNSATKQVIISHNKFYGSPSKTPDHSKNSGNSTAQSVPAILSFSERMKKNSMNSNAVTSQPSSLNDFESSLSAGSNAQNHPLLANSIQTQYQQQTQATPSQQFLFSPMKRLRLDDGLKTGDGIGPFKNRDHDYVLTSSNSGGAGDVGANINIKNSTANEFIDCIELLNQAEKKVQNRQQLQQQFSTMINNDTVNSSTSSILSSSSSSAGASNIDNSIPKYNSNLKKSPSFDSGHSSEFFANHREQNSDRNGLSFNNRFGI
jgi:hypothetical protein